MTCEQVKPFGGEMECTNSAEIKSLRAQLSALTEERDTLKAEVEHWKANHADMVKRNAALRDRPDLPPERVKAVQAIIEERDRYREEAARLRESLSWLKSISFSREDDLDPWPGEETRRMIDAALSLSPLSEREAEREAEAAVLKAAKRIAAQIRQLSQESKEGK